jgi:hypothetical protein
MARYLVMEQDGQVFGNGTRWPIFGNGTRRPIFGNGKRWPDIWEWNKMK